jgi:hypothetical protein
LERCGFRSLFVQASEKKRLQQFKISKVSAFRRLQGIPETWHAPTTFLEEAEEYRAHRLYFSPEAKNHGDCFEDVGALLLS